MLIKLKRIIKLLFVNLLVLAILSISLELLGRGVAYLTLGPKSDRYIVWEDSQLGWSLNTRGTSQVRQNRCGEEIKHLPPDHPVIVKRPTIEGEQTVLFLGDSYTHAHEVSSGQAYYDVFETMAGGDVSVFSVGVGGYGTLQEFMALEIAYDQIKPDVVIWQLSGNDVENNVFEYEKTSLANNNQRPRPYLDLHTGKIEIMNPGFFLLQQSDLTRFLFQKFLMIDQKFKLGLIEKLKQALYPRGEKRKDFQRQGLEVLNRLLNKAQKKYPDTRFYGFNVGGGYDQEFEQIFVQNGAGYFPLFHEYVRQVEKTDCRPFDSHWNHLGNRVAGKALLRLFRQAEANDLKAD